MVGFAPVPHFAVEESSPLDTLHPANVHPLFDGAETRKAVPYAAFVGAYVPFVPPSSAYQMPYVMDAGAAFCPVAYDALKVESAEFVASIQ